MFAQSRYPLARGDLRARHPERHVHHAEFSAVVFDFGERTAMRELGIVV